MHGDIQRHPDFGKLCNRLAEETLLCAAPAIDCCCRNSCAVFAPTQSYSERAPNKDDCVVLELSALGKRGETIARAREQVLEILQLGNACSAWFQEADPDATEVFRSLHFEMEMKGPSYVYGIREDPGVRLRGPVVTSC